MPPAKTDNPRFSTFYKKLSLWDRFQLNYKNKPGPLETECWIWTGTIWTKKRKDVYGCIVSKGMKLFAHRVAWELYNNCSLTPDIFVCHKCDVTLCVNPDHLFLGDCVSNIMDRDIKKRGPLGEKHGNSKLTQKDVQLIRQLHKEGKRQSEIVTEFNISKSVISGIVNNQSWKHI